MVQTMKFLIVEPSPLPILIPLGPKIITEPIIDELSTNCRSVAGLGEMENVVLEISQQNL